MSRGAAAWLLFACFIRRIRWPRTAQLPCAIWKPMPGCDMIRATAEEDRDAAEPRAIAGVRRRWLPVSAGVLFRCRGGGAAARRRGDLPLRQAGSVAREVGGAAHRLRRASLQPGLPPAGLASALDRAGRAAVWRKALY